MEGATQASRLDEDGTAAALDLRGAELLAQLQCLVQLRLLVNVSSGGLSLGEPGHIVCLHLPIANYLCTTSAIHFTRALCCPHAESCKLKCNVDFSTIEQLAKGFRPAIDLRVYFSSQ